MLFDSHKPLQHLHYFGSFIVSKVMQHDLITINNSTIFTSHAYHMVTPSLNAVVTHLRKAASYEPRIAILGILGDTWLTRGKYGIYVAVRGSYGALTGST